MRFGKRLAEVTQNGSAKEPYIAYKELKHTVSKLAALIGAGGHPGPKGSHIWGASSEDEEIEGAGRRSSGAVAMAAFGGSASSGNGCSAAAAAGLHTLDDDAAASLAPVEALQQEFFRRIDADVSQAKFYLQRIIAMLEASVGEWQSAAIFAGFLFTPEQLEDVSGTLPFQTQNKGALVEWLTGLQADSKNEETAHSLIQKYNDVVTIVNEVLQYIEVNLTAIRKIFKKFEKKLPEALRIRQVGEYTKHHELFLPSMQHLLVTVMHMQRIIYRIPASQAGKCEASQAVPLACLGPESMSLVSFLRGPLTRDDSLPSRIDVYAKPSAAVISAARAPSPPRQAAPRASAEGGPGGCSGGEGLGADALGASGLGISINADRGRASGEAAGSMTGHSSIKEDCDAMVGGRGRKNKSSRGGRGRHGVTGQPGPYGSPDAGVGWRGHPTGGACGSGTAGSGPGAPPPGRPDTLGSHFDAVWGAVHLGAHMGYGQPGTFAPQGQFAGAAQVPMYVGKGGRKGRGRGGGAAAAAAWPPHLAGKGGRARGGAAEATPRPAMGGNGIMPMLPFFWPGLPFMGGGEDENPQPYARRL